jgi:hypothetical protein
MSRAEYEKAIKDLEAAGAANPEGRTTHVSYGDENEVHVFETWNSREEFERYHQNRMAVLQASGLDAGIVEVSDLHLG